MALVGKIKACCLFGEFCTHESSSESQSISPTWHVQNISYCPVFSNFLFSLPFFPHQPRNGKTALSWPGHVNPSIPHTVISWYRVLRQIKYVWIMESNTSVDNISSRQTCTFSTRMHSVWLLGHFCQRNSPFTHTLGNNCYGSSCLRAFCLIVFKSYPSKIGKKKKTKKNQWFPVFTWAVFNVTTITPKVTRAMCMCLTLTTRWTHSHLRQLICAMKVKQIDLLIEKRKQFAEVMRQSKVFTDGLPVRPVL